MLSRITRLRSLAAGLFAVLALALLPAMLAPATAHAQAPRVVELFERGLVAYREGRFAEAAALFAEAHDIEPIADLTYNRARALENLGRLRDAAAAYRLFLEESPASTDRRGIEERIRALEERAAEAERLEEERARLAQERERLAEERARAAVRSTTEPPRASAGPWPWVVAGAGALTLGAAGLTGWLAQDTHDRARSLERTQPESERLEAEAQDLAVVTNVLLIAGGVITLGGVVWGVIDLASSGPGSPSVALQLGPAGATLRGTF